MNKYIFIVSVEHPEDRNTALDWLHFILIAGITDTGVDTRGAELGDLEDDRMGKADITISYGDKL